MVYRTTARGATASRTVTLSRRAPATPWYPAPAEARGRMPSEGISARARTVAVCRPGAALTREVQVIVVSPRIRKPWPPGQRSVFRGTAGSVSVTRCRSAPERLVSRYRLMTG